MIVKFCWKRHIFFSFLLCWLLLLLLLLNDFPQLLRCEGHINVRDTKCINNGIGHRRTRTNGTSLTYTFDTKWIDRGQGDRMIKFIGRQFLSNGHGVVHQRTCQQLTIFTVDNLLPHGLTHTLSNTTMNLALHKQRIELASTVIDGHKARNLCLTGLFIYLDNADMSAKGEDTGFWLEKDGCFQTRLNTGSKCVGEVGCGGDLIKGNSLWR